MVHVIDSDDYKASGISTMFFPGGEPHAKLPIFKDDVLLFLKLRTWNDVGIALCVIDALHRQTGFSIHKFIPYFPGARQDRSHNVDDPVDGKAPLTLEIMGDLFSLPWSSRQLVVFDVHSDKAYQYTTIGRSFMPADIGISDLGFPLRANVAGIIAPDKGAVVRATQFRNAFYPTAELVLCKKRRDPATGLIDEDDYEFPQELASGHYICVDDICDGGRTFNLLAQGFKIAKNSENCTLELFVSHGIFSKGLDNLDPRIIHITTTDSFCRLEESERLTVIKLAPLFDKIVSGELPRPLPTVIQYHEE